MGRGEQSPAPCVRGVNIVDGKEGAMSSHLRPCLHGFSDILFKTAALDDIQL